MLPLKGIKVLDLTRVLAGPYCTMLLGDLGANIYKLEIPGSGDDTRQWGPPWIGAESAYFVSVNRNKKSIAINFKSPAGQQLVQKLSDKCDVFIENFLPGKLKPFGLAYEELKERNRGLVYCSITGYGQDGPYSNRGGYDVMASAQGGLMHITEPADGPPCRVGVAMTDLSTGLYAHGAILAALMNRTTTGEGQHIDCNLLNTQVATLSHIASNYLNAGVEASRWGTGHSSIVPYQAFNTQDGTILVGAGNNKLFSELLDRLGLAHVESDKKYSTNELRVENRDELINLLQSRFQLKTTHEWTEIFYGATFPYSKVNKISDVFSDPQVLHNDMIQVMEHPTLGEVRVPGPAVRYSGRSAPARLPPPLLGQHTADVLTDELGCSSAEVT